MSGKVVVDTNVPVVANGRDTHADKPCRLDCIKAIRDVRSHGTVVLDDQDLIFEEYRKNLNFKGEPGVGDAFFKHVFDHMYSQSRVSLVRITCVNDGQQGFAELPRNTLDPDDRKFLAVAIVANAPILNATDSDWRQQSALLHSLSVTAKQLCPQHAQSMGGAAAAPAQGFSRT